MRRYLLLTLTFSLVTAHCPALAQQIDPASIDAGELMMRIPVPPSPAVKPWRDFVPAATDDHEQRVSGLTQRQAIRIEQSVREAQLPKTATAQYGMHPGVILSVTELPPTRMSSFVADSGYDERIYGDEGTDSRPPIDGYEYENTIESGLCNCGGEGITTGHHPDADMTHGYQWYATGQVDYDPGR